MRGRRGAGRKARTHRQGIRGARRKEEGNCEAREGAPGVRKGSNCAVQVSARNRIQGLAPKNEYRETAALPIAEEEKVSAAPGPEIILPDGWPRPSGYANGAVATGKYA